jgi:hypothetical protein
MRKLPVVLICRTASGLRHTSDTPHIDGVLCPIRGALRDRHERWMRDAMDEGDIN